MNKYLLYFIIGIVILIFSCQAIKETSQQNDIPSNENISYNSTIKSIIDNHCISCHAGQEPAAGFKLTTYKEVRLQAEEGLLLKKINDRIDPMPMGGLMAKNLRLSIENWARNGYKENTKSSDNSITDMTENNFIPPTITPIDISKRGFTFFDLMQGHWVGKMNIMGQKYDWFSFDYRPISPSHIHGIYEGGTMGNLFTSFFIADFKGTKTIMVRNGGILKGIYRTSYFILDKVELSDKRKYFRFIDSYGGKDIMWMELEFINDKLNFNSYTSRFGATGKPSIHMEFKASRKHPEISYEVAKKLKYPQNKIEKSFSDGLPLPKWGEEYPTVTSASYIYRDTKEDLITLGRIAGDPYPINEMPYLSSLKVNIEQNDKIQNHSLIIYLSKAALTDDKGFMIREQGYIKQSIFDTVLSFPNISLGQEEFTFNYLHSGEYYITIVADVNKDGYISKGDIMSTSSKLSILPEEKITFDVNDIVIQN